MTVHRVEGCYRLIGVLAVLSVSILSSGRTFGQESPGSAPGFPFAAADAAASALPRLHSLLISHDGELLFEQYYNGIGATRQANMKSASKTVISALVGIAIDQGLIESVDQPIGDYFADVLPGDENAAKRAITIEDLLTMRSGLETTSNRNYGAWVVSSNWVRHVLNKPLIAEPGSRMIYSTGNTHLLSAILTKASGTTTWRFAQDSFAQPQGFNLSRWLRDPQGLYFGGNDMTMTPRQMLAFGELYLNGGRTSLTEVIPEAWVRASHVARTLSPRGRGRFYGYGWWIRGMGGHATFYAWGYGGQFVFVVPTLDLVVVTTSNSNPGDGRQAHLQRIYELVEDHIVVPISSDETRRLTASTETNVSSSAVD